MYWKWIMNCQNIYVLLLEYNYINHTVSIHYILLTWLLSDILCIVNIYYACYYYIMLVYYVIYYVLSIYIMLVLYTVGILCNILCIVNIYYVSIIYC